jgi:predicted nucleotidyltransferase
VSRTCASFGRVSEKKREGWEDLFVTTSVRNKAEALQRILGARRQLASLGVLSIGLFGSFARGEQTPSSDVDLLVEFAPEKHSFDNFMETAFLLEDLLARRVELVTPQALSPHIGPQILREVERVPIAA